MPSVRRRHALRALAPAVLALVAAASPAGAWVEQVATAKIGAYSDPDTYYPQGAVCRYEGPSNNPDLTSIVIKPIQAHAYYNQSQKILYRFVIQRDRYQNGNWTRYYKSPWIHDFATHQTITDFPQRTFSGFPHNPQGRWRARVILRWVKPGTRSTEDGKLVGLIEEYKHRWGTFSNVSGNPYCLESY